MALAMVVVALMWVRRPSNRRRANAGWLEEARRSTLIGRTDGVDATAHVTARDIDDDEQALAGYNAWLADLEREHPTP
jgi:hypothetical protein